ncbi:unnamed protein product, partial [Rotaria sp. Silwood2]
CSRRVSAQHMTAIRISSRAQPLSMSTSQATTSNSSTTLKRSSLPSHEKITKRVKSDVSLTSSSSNVPMDSYTILQNQVLFSLMSKTNCEDCGKRWNGTMNIKKREGLFLILSFECLSCKNTINIETSPKIVSSARRDINVRSQIGSHLCGIKYAGLAKLMGAMNLPGPIQDERYSRWNKDLLLSIKSLSDRSMRKGIEEAVAAANSKHLMVSGDGFWQTRGFKSRHGAAALISCGTAPKVVDIETCHKTSLAIKKSNPNKFKDILKSHQCEKNYEKSSGTMESSAVLSMFNRSISKYGVHYTSYIGDGDSKAFSTLSKATPYPAQTIIRLQMTFRSTIQKYKHNLKLLYKRSWAIFWHKYSSNDDPHHKWCSIKWCGYLKSIRDKTSYDHTSHALPRPVLNAIKPVFKNLCSRESLSRVINASTQNPNECFHSIVWLMSPKNKATSGTIFEIASHLAVIIFNNGYFVLGDLFNVVCGYRGYYTEQAMINLDNNRLHTESKEMNRKKRKEVSRMSQQNDEKSDDDEQINTDGEQTSSDDRQTSDDTDQSNTEDEQSSASDEQSSASDEQAGDDNEQASDDDEDTSDDNEETSNDDENTSDDNDETTNEDVKSSCETNDSDYGYYNSKDKRLWKEQE